MKTIVKALGALAIAGTVAVGGSAFTGTGLANSAGATQFIGGTIDQTVTGATLNGVVYGYSDDTHTAVSSVALTFAAPLSAAQDVSVALTDGAVVPITTTDWTCTTTDGTLVTITCSAGTNVTNLHSLAVTVDNI